MISILDAGPMTTVQDLGRFGQLRYGVPQSGPMDRFAFVLANRLAGNDDAAAALEYTLIGPRFEVDAACAVAVTGAETALTINGRSAPTWTTLRLEAGDVVKVGTARAGVRGYIAFCGGIDVPVVMGSRSTYARGKLGGVDGRALRTGDRLRLLAAPLPRPARVAPTFLPQYPSEAMVRVVLGPQADRFSRDGIDAFLRSAYEVLPQSDRMGVRLRGERIAHARGHDIVSDGVALGSVQVPGDGQPIVLMADRQSAGGYPKLATVCSFDIGRLSQLRPGQSLRFQAIDIDEAHRLLRQFEAMLESELTQEIA